MLDLIMSRHEEHIVQSIDVHDPTISDHYTVTCKLNLKKPSFQKRVVKSRKIKAINIDSFVNDIRLSPIITENTGDISVKVNQYNSENRDIIIH